MSITSVDRAKLAAPPAPLVRPLVLWVMRLAALVAACVSGYIMTISFAGSESVGCGSGFDCDEVLNSRWATWFGISVAVPGLSLYVSLLGTLAFAGPLVPENVRRTAWTISLWLSTLAGAAALWFFGLQLFVVGEFCSWCLTVHMCGLGLAALAVFTRRQSWARLHGAAAVALSGIAVLAVGQIFGPQVNKPQLQRIAASDHRSPTATNGRKPVTAQRLTLDDLYPQPRDPIEDAPPDDDSDDDVAEPTIDDDPPPPPSPDDLALPDDFPDEEPDDVAQPASVERRTRVVSVFRGKALVDVYQHPVLGSPEAPHVVVKLFDYTCPHCREMHEHLQEARREFGNRLSVVMCPVPLNKQCNPHMQVDNPKHAQACDLARLALAVWQADPAKFEEFDAWLFSSPLPPNATMAREKAVALVGEAQLSAELFSEELRDRLAVGPKLYKLLGTGTVPKLLLPTGMLVGPGEGTAAVVQELRREFGDEAGAGVLP
jgi:uncharacterized membrane protein/protein-disulfide isomerase